MDERHQEKVLARLLARNLRQHLQPGGADCPDADLLAAYSERSLGDAETPRLEAHFSVCGRCQEALAALTLSKSEPSTAADKELVPAVEGEVAGVVAAMAEVSAAAPPPATVAMKAAAPAARPAVLGSPEYVKPKRRFWSVRWLAPAVAAAAAVLLWIGLRPHLFVPRAPSTQEKSKIASAPTAEVTPSGTPAEPPKELAQNVPPPPAAEVEGRAQRAVDEVGRAPLKEPAAKPRGAQALDQLQREPQTLMSETTGQQPSDKKRVTRSGAAGIVATPTGAISGEKERADEALEARRKEAETAGAAAAKPEAGVTQTVEVTRAAGKTNADKLAEKPAGVATLATLAAPPPASKAEEAPKKAASVQAGAGPDAPPQQFKAAMRQRMVFPPAQVSVTTPNASVLWRVGPAGQIEHTRDAGRTWTAQASNVEVDLVAGSAPAETVCWVVGRAGTVLRTTNGEHWEKVSPPTAMDLIRVKAVDAWKATVVAADQQRYVTSDGGKTWRTSTE
ncbi:MAG: hypothetical protein HY237_08620 [Acidobacteria bacterium]|nr:hypothetical protein [Acidobacteriota bacterium]